jgi:hypothetical protein
LQANTGLALREEAKAHFGRPAAFLKMCAVLYRPSRAFLGEIHAGYSPASLRSFTQRDVQLVEGIHSRPRETAGFQSEIHVTLGRET